LLHVA
jgi:hypothetical protein